MQFGIFDHVDRGGSSLADIYENRLKLIELYESLGFWGYHVAEHHSTPLGMAPSPSVYLASAIQRTKRIHLGPLVYLLPLYNPLRLIEEVCMLDNLSRGRLLVGVGRGISPFELQYYGRNPDEAKDIFDEALQVLQIGLEHETLTYSGKHFQFENVPMELRPFQRPTPSIWLGVSSTESAAIAGRRGLNIVGLMPAASMKSRVDAYRDAAQGRDNGQKIGLSYLVVVGEDEKAAIRRASEAYKAWHASFHHLYKLHGRGPMLAAWPTDFEELMAQKRAVAGSPERVADFLEEAKAESGINYALCQMMFGDLPHEYATRSIRTFAEKVMPRFA